MPNPDVAVPSLPEHPEHNHSWSQREAGAIRDFARAAVIADRAAGRASAEPEKREQQIAKAAALIFKAYNTPRDRYPDDYSYSLFLSQQVREAHGVMQCVRGVATWSEDNCAAPTPTASIAPKAEGEAEWDGICGTCDGRGCPVCHPEPYPESFSRGAPKAEGGEEVARAACPRCGWTRGHDYGCPNDPLNPGVVDRVREAKRVAREYALMRATDEECFAAIDAIAVAPVSQAAAGASEDVALWQLVYGAIMGADRKPVSIADFDAAAKRVADMIERRAALSPRPEADADRASGGGV